MLSFKQQVPMSRVRDILAGSGKMSSNSNHFDRSTAQYFRPDRPFKTRNLNNTMTEHNLQHDKANGKIDPIATKDPLSISAKPLQLKEQSGGTLESQKITMTPKMGDT